MNKHGHRGDRVIPNAKIRMSEVVNVAQTANKTMRRIDTGNVRIARSTGRKKDYLIKTNERFKNIASENDKLDYMTRNFCTKPAKSKKSI